MEGKNFIDESEAGRRVDKVFGSIIHSPADGSIELGLGCTEWPSLGSRVAAASRRNPDWTNSISFSLGASLGKDPEIDAIFTRNIRKVVLIRPCESHRIEKLCPGFERGPAFIRAIDVLIHLSALRHVQPFSLRLGLKR